MGKRCRPELKHITSSYDCRPLVGNSRGWHVQESRTYTSQLIPPIVQGAASEQRVGNAVCAKYFTAKILISNYAVRPTIMANPDAVSYADAAASAIPRELLTTLSPGGEGVKVRCMVTIWKPRFGMSWRETTSDQNAVTVPFRTKEVYTHRPWVWDVPNQVFGQNLHMPTPEQLKCDPWDGNLPVPQQYGKGPFPVAEHGYWDPRLYDIVSQKTYTVPEFSTKLIKIKRRWGGHGKRLEWQERQGLSNVAAAGWTGNSAHPLQPTQYMEPTADQDSLAQFDSSEALVDVEDQIFMTLQFYNTSNQPYMGPACLDSSGAIVPFYCAKPAQAPGPPWPHADVDLPSVGFAYSSRLYFEDCG